ncbi:MAG TPA: ATP-binding cassette domain-containing protein [Nitrospiraceae bacterium]|nr:ATP-binding cassette domain-containing protein [Nitrospiraceae bacterium]
MSRAIELADVVVELDGEGRTAHLSLAVAAGEFLMLVGPNRSGKSLIVELCAGLVAPHQGTVRVLGKEWVGLSDEGRMKLRRRIGTVLQLPGLLSNMTVFNNVALPLRYHRSDLSEPEIQRVVMSQLEALGLAPLRDRFPAQLNPGEIRCAAIARSMVLDQELLLLDDPLAGLDAEMIHRLGAHLTNRRQGGPFTIVATMRSYSSFLNLADRVAVLRGGQIEATGSRSTVAKQVGVDMSTYFG